MTDNELRVAALLERLTAERVELGVKIDRLKVFVVSTPYMDLSEVEQGLLLAQCDAMVTYARLLTMRINLVRGQA